MNVNSRSLSNIFRGDGLKSGYPFSFLDKLHPGGSDGKESACNAEDLGSIPGSGRAPGGGHATHYSCLDNPMDRGAWHGVANSGT